jgi:integrase
MGVYNRGTKKKPNWWISYTYGGKQIREPVKGAKYKGEAEELFRERKREIFHGTYFPEKRRTGLTMGGLRDLWLEHAASKKSKEDDEHRFGVLIELLGERAIVTALTPADIERLKAQLLETKTWKKATRSRSGEKMAPASVNRHLALLKSALRVAKANGYQHRDPMQGVKMLAEHNKRDRVCSAKEYKALVEASSGSLRLAIVLGYHTGMRLGEIATLTWDRVDLKNRVIKLRSSHTKTGKERVVPIAAEVVRELKKMPRRNDGDQVLTFSEYRRKRIVSKPGTGPKASALSPRFAELCSQLDIIDLHFHDLRHTCATNLRRGGADVFTIAAMLGHADLSTLRRYQTVTAEDLHKAIGKAKR